MCLQFALLFFSFGRTSAFPSFTRLRNQAPACAEPGKGPRVRESPGGRGLWQRNLPGSWENSLQKLGTPRWFTHPHSSSCQPSRWRGPSRGRVGFHPIYRHTRPLQVLRFSAEIGGIRVNDLWAKSVLKKDSLFWFNQQGGWKWDQCHPACGVHLPWSSSLSWVVDTCSSYRRLQHTWFVLYGPEAGIPEAADVGGPSAM